MGNKLFYSIIGIVVVAFVGVFLYMNNSSSEPEQLSDSGYYPYTDLETDELSGPTIDKLDDENYHYNQTLDEVNATVDNGEGKFVYYSSPTCQHCENATPYLIDAFENTGEEV